jgi:glycosidase
MHWSGAGPVAGFSNGGAIPWHAVNPDYPAINVERENTDPASLLSLYKRLVRLRATIPALRHGVELPVTVSSDRVFASLRKDGDSWVLILANLGTEPIRNLLVEAQASLFVEGYALREELQGVSVRQPQTGAGGRLSAWTPIAELAPRSVYVLHKKP